MRILVVSAHYPPNFVSGGTLQPQRLAHGLQARGHDVAVYAGWLGARAPLTAWVEADDRGLPVRWISTGRFIGWADRRNFDNPPVRDDFARFAAEFEPDVVHLHSLQSLGATLVPAAAEQGARVVVTMHDFWWLCARQFLVDPDYQPCCPVVDAGVCPCQVDRTWLARRRAELMQALTAADLILAPSAIAASVLEANGIGPTRLVVDENGLPDEALTAPATVPSPNGPVRFTYTGGPNRMKGIDVLLEAARPLASLAGWELTAYGAGEYVEESATSLTGLPVRVAPPFEPAELDDVLGQSDVFVITSVAQETYSIATREALLRGVPVLTSDSLGPSEVVVDGVNGLVVPAADAPSLAAAMRRVVEEPGLLARLREGCRAQPVRLRSLREQIDGLERRYGTLLAGPAGGSSRRPGRAGIERVLFIVGIEGAPLRYRARLPAEALSLLGVDTDVRHYRDATVPERLWQADVVVVYRVPATHQVLALLDGARDAGTPTVFDVDDLIFDPEILGEVPALRRLASDEYALYLQGVERYRTTLEHCDGYIGSTPALVEHAASVTGLPAAQFDNGVGLALGQASDAALRRARRPGPLRIGYLSGTTTHDEDWFYVEPAVIDTLERHRDAELWLTGHLPESSALARFGRRVRRLPFQHWLQLPELLRDLDINLAPLVPASRFNEAKSAIKWLEAALVATPTVASPTVPFRDAIDDGRTGRLAADVEGFAVALDELASSPLRRRVIGAAARRAALLRWSPHLQARRYREILHSAFEWRERPRPASMWTDVALDEPPLAYTLPDDVAVSATATAGS